MTEQQAIATQDKLYDLAKKHLEETGLEDNYWVGLVQAIRHSDGNELNTQVSFIWGGEKWLHGKIWLEMAGALFNLGIQVINSIAKTEKVAVETIMETFAEAMKMAHDPENQIQKSKKEEKKGSLETNVAE